jgi:hypothetical protein
VTIAGSKSGRILAGMRSSRRRAEFLRFSAKGRCSRTRQKTQKSNLVRE